MSEDREKISSGAAGAPRWQGLAVGILAVISFIALGIGWNAGKQAQDAQQGLKTELSAIKQDDQVLGQRLAQAEQVNAQVQGELNVVTDRMKLTQGELARARKQSKQIRENYDKQLTDMETSVKSELATKASNDDMKTLGTDVTGVKSDLENTKQNLQMARGELGTLIARNHEDLEQLRRMGQRDYYEFTLNRKEGRQKVADLGVELRGTNTKKHIFTVNLYVDDMRLEKRNRSVNEPIYFYTRGSRAPLELVVNQISKDKVVGYVSVPKANPQTATGGQ
jgi:chromosome segregation ATPase